MSLAVVSPLFIFNAQPSETMSHHIDRQMMEKRLLVVLKPEISTFLMLSVEG